MGRTIINNYIGKEGVINNTIGKDDDPDKKDIPDRSNRLIVVTISVIASLVAIITFFVKKDYLPDPPPGKDTTVIIQSPNTGNIKIEPPGRVPQKLAAAPAAAHKSINQSTLAISIHDASGNFDGAAAQQVCDFFNSNNYRSTIIPAPLRDKNYAHVAEGLLTVSDAADIPGANGSHTLNYTVKFTLTFYKLPEDAICGVLPFLTVVQMRKTNIPENKEDIKQQGLDKILKNIRDIQSIPACD